MILRKKEQKDLQMNAIRKCSVDCYFFKNGGEGCQFFIKKQVKHGEVCMHDMVQLKNYADAFRDNDLEYVKKDASGITAMLMMQIRRMLEQVAIEGVTVEEPMVDAKGQPVWIPDPNWRPGDSDQPRMVVAMRMKDHPLIQRSIQLARSIGVDLAEFKLTPKSADEKKSVSGHIITGDQKDMKQIMEDRKVIEDRFLEAMKKGTEMTKKDPIYIQLAADGEIIE